MNRLYMKQKVFSLSERFTIKDQNETDKYFVEGSFFKIPKTFTIKDVNENKVARVTKKIFSFLPKFFVEVDGKEELMIQKQFAFFKARYRIEGKNISVRGDWWDKHFDVLSRDQVIGHVNEKWFTWGDTYEIDVEDESFEQIMIALVVAIDFVKQEAS
ncbi:LURP-one-related/scramblase family protein [Amphibacillus cookii]|uniref:LURP-one-related/scramblase family protein n=1 Tax=Amphibacillus cookii TaxID=767787 RepID=UPI00195717A3|nr:LURP-one-related family protein [Amphibacillus cookii]MBM7541065.1 uncharacterized protein YxjI [Amphibacillus cookii]